MMTIPSAIAEQTKKIDEFYNSQSEQDPESNQLEEGGDPKGPSSSNQSQSPEEDYEKRFKNYKASTDVTLHQLRQELDKLRKAEQENQELKQYLSQVKQNPEVPKFSEEALQSFSQEELNIFNKMLEERVADKTDQLVRKVSYLESKLSEREQQEQQEFIKRQHLTLKQQVASAVPEFDKIDTSPEFKKWLNGLDAYGTLRMDALRKAQANKDVARIISFYNDFRQVQEPVKVDPRELQQTPSSRGSSVPNSSKQTRVWDKESIQKFYRDSALGKISQDRHNEIEREIQEYYLSR